MEGDILGIGTELYSEIIEKAPQGILLVKRNFIEAQNKLARDILQLGKSLIPLEDFFNRINPIDLDLVENWFIGPFKDPIPNFIEFRFDCGHSQRWIRSNFVQIEGAILHFIVDVTENKIAKEALLRSEKLAAVGTLAGGIAHEFNNIHAIIMGYLSICLQKVGDSEITRMLENCLSASRRASGITENLLEFTQNKPSRRSMVDLRTVISDTLRMLGNEMESEGISVEMLMAEIPEVWVDKNQIGQVLLNFVLNARHAMINSEDKIIRVKIGESEGKIFLSVSDTGCGITESDIRCIFTPFFSTKGEHSRPGSSQSGVKGTGLGLSVCESIARSHGGKIEVESKPTKGSTFILWLPIQQEMDQKKNERKKQVTEKSKEGIVWILDDEEFIRDIGVRYLADFYSTVAWEDGNEVLKNIVKNRVDVIVLDIQMPKMSGLRFVERLTQLNLESPPKILILTGRLDSHEISSFKKWGVTDFMEKPFSQEELINNINRLL